MSTLSRELRRQLDRTVRAARRVAEEGATKALQQLGIERAKAPDGLSPDQKALRDALRAHGRQLGDARDPIAGTQKSARLTREFAYEHWHRMLFARFLAENELLIEPKSGMAISLADCRELARERNEDWLALASSFAQTMLPQIFRVGDPVLAVSLPPETRSQLDDLLKSLPQDIFSAEDSLGWVYQFWQADSKKSINDAGIKIGADELSAVTQLFTEDYMVWFLLHNTLGAWWAGKVLASSPELERDARDEHELRAACAVGGIEWTYLRFVREPLPTAAEYAPDKTLPSPSEHNADAFLASPSGENIGGESVPNTEPTESRWRPAAGTFDGWPTAAKDITLLDPCMGSGHFLVFALPILAALRAEEEDLEIDTALVAVLRDNLFGLELDARCTQIAAFNLALAAWKRVGYRALPQMHLACSGLSLGVSKDEWLKLAESASAELPVPPEQDLLGTKRENLFSDAMKRGFERLHDLFAKAPTLGSLIQPRVGGDLIERGFTDLEPLLAKVMAKADNAELSEMAVAAQGLAKAAEILAGRFTLVATNVPYLGRGKQDESLKHYCEVSHPSAKADLATCFVERCLTFCASGGTTALVTPQGWLFLGAYKRLRKRLLQVVEWNVVARLGARAFETITGEVVNVANLMLTLAQSRTGHSLAGVEAGAATDTSAKAALLRTGHIATASQESQLLNPDCRVSMRSRKTAALLSMYATAWQGIGTSDNSRFLQAFWELPTLDSSFRFVQVAPSGQVAVSGANYVLLWADGGGKYLEHALALKAEKRLGGWKSGGEAWGREGFAVSVTRAPQASLYLQDMFDTTVAAVIPNDRSNAAAVYAYLNSPEYLSELREIDQALSITEHTLLKVPFDVDVWREAAAHRYPNGLPTPHSDDSTQWLFGGNPRGSDSPLQVAVARLLSYRWPRQTGSTFPDCPTLEPDGLEAHADGDGIVALTAIKGEAGAAERLVALLADAYGAEWSAAKLAALMDDAGYAGVTLDDWLRDHFFEEHCALFHQRPFVWHIWDGRRDGFYVLVNYHRLVSGDGEGRRLLEKLTHSYLGDWIDRQRADQKTGLEGADARLASAVHLKAELEKILAGAPPYDLFVRWKPVAEQAIGWEPDINDGVRMNIRPFMTARPFDVRAKNACILRTTPKIKWDKDRGKEPARTREDFPWFWTWDGATQDFAGAKGYDGNRWNNLHYSIAAKQTARAKWDAK